MRYLKEEEKWKSRDLWEEAFPEDSREFDDYYFREKIKNNRIIVKEEAGRIISMAQLNPYLVRIRDREYVLPYIVGVATRKDCRHQGHMRDILIKMMEDMQKEEVPFVFLMPAAEAIYRPFGFRFIFSQPKWKKKKEGLTERQLSLETLLSEEGKTDRQWIASWQQRFLEERWEVHTVRDEGYIREICGEIASEAGEWNLLYDARTGSLVGMESIWGLEKKEQRFLYADSAYTEQAAPDKPAIMARITNVQEFLKNVCLKQDAPEETLSLVLEIKDPLIRENNGVFQWNLDRNGAVLDVSEKKPELSMEIEQLAEWLFGRLAADEIPDIRGLSWIRPFQGVFLDEVV